MKTQTDSKSILDNPTVLERAIIYARVSTDEQAESGTSIDNQVKESLAYAVAHNLYVPPEFIFREDYSGKELDRPELNKVLKTLREGKADTLIIYKVDRQDRSWAGINYLILLRELKELGVSFHKSQAGRQVDLNDDTQILLEGIEGWQAGKDHKDTVEKLHNGRINRAKSGYVVVHGNPPYGYCTFKGEDKKWHLEPDEHEANIIKLIFTWYVLGDETGQTLTLHRIAARLNEIGIPTRKKSVWCKTTIHGIVSNETYAGVWRYGKKGKQGKNPKEHHVSVKVEPLVSREIWEAAQERLEHNKEYAQRNRKRLYLMANRLTCGDCGYKIAGSANQGGYTYYRCPTKTNDELRVRRDCHLPGFNASVVDSKIWDKLEEVSRDKDKLIEGLRDYQALQESKVEPIKRELAYVEDLIKEKTAEWEDDYASMKFLPERAKAKKGVEIANTEKVLGELEKRKHDLLAQLQEKSLTDEQIIGTAAFASQVADDMATLREAEAKGLELPELKAAVYEAKRRLLALLDVQVTLFVRDGKKMARITAKYCPDGYTVELDNTKIAVHNRKNWLLFECEIDLE